MKTNIESITPKVAAQMLAHNTHNRPAVQGVVKRYARFMREGRWVDNGESIKFASGGRLIDGQHRLMAIVESGITCKCVVVRGLPSDAFETIDRGRGRKNSDALSMAGYANANMLAASLNWAVALAAGRNAQHAQCEPDQVCAIAQRYPSAQESCRFGAGVARKLGGKLKGSYVAALHMIASSKGLGAECEEFFAQVVTGERLISGSPVLALRAVMITDATGIRSERYVRLMIKAWNAHMQGRAVSNLSVKADEPWPVVVLRRV